MIHVCKKSALLCANSGTKCVKIASSVVRANVTAMQACIKKQLCDDACKAQDEPPHESNLRRHVKKRETEERECGVVEKNTQSTVGERALSLSGL